MRQRKKQSTILVLFIILTRYETEPAGFNGHKGSDNPKDLQIIHDKFTIAKQNTIDIVVSHSILFQNVKQVLK